MIFDLLVGLIIGLVLVLALLMALVLLFCLSCALRWMFEDLIAPVFDDWGDRS